MREPRREEDGEDEGRADARQQHRDAEGLQGKVQERRMFLHVTLNIT